MYYRDVARNFKVESKVFLKKVQRQKYKILLLRN